MYIKIKLLIFFFLSSYTITAADTTIISVKYRFTCQKDSTDPQIKSNDIMILSITNSSSIYYSLLKHIGYGNIEKKALEDMTQKQTVSNEGQTAKDVGSFFMGNEPEVINLDFAKMETTITNKFIENCYGYKEALDVPKWSVDTAVTYILNVKSYLATTTYKGRNYKAWYAVDIPISRGPWLFNGLPGLILKVTDDKGQFEFECIELNIPSNVTNIFTAYSSVRYVSKKNYVEKKKLFSQNLIEFLKAENGVFVRSSDGTNVVRPNKPYNPIDLSN